MYVYQQFCWWCSVGVMILIIPPLGKLFSPFVSHPSILPLPLVCVWKCNYSPCQPCWQYGGVRLHTVTGQGGQSDNLASRRILFYLKLRNVSTPLWFRNKKKRDSMSFMRYMFWCTCSVSSSMTQRWHSLQFDSLPPTASASIDSFAWCLANREKPLFRTTSPRRHSSHYTPRWIKGKLGTAPRPTRWWKRRYGWARTSVSPHAFRVAACLRELYRYK